MWNKKPWKQIFLEEYRKVATDLRGVVNTVVSLLRNFSADFETSAKNACFILCHPNNKILNSKVKVRNYIIVDDC